MTTDTTTLLDHLLDAAFKELQHDTGPQDIEYQFQRKNLRADFKRILWAIASNATAPTEQSEPTIEVSIDYPNFLHIAEIKSVVPYGNGRLSVLVSPPASLAQPTGDEPKLPPLNDAMKTILGRMCFQCIRIAALLRLDGQVIAEKAEAEQAAVIYWLLTLYMEHGDEWADVAEEKLAAIKEAHHE